LELLQRPHLQGARIDDLVDADQAVGRVSRSNPL
jgi:hypothetical protein